MTDMVGKTIESATYGRAYGQADSWLEIVFTDGTAIIVEGTGYEVDGVSVEPTIPGERQRKEDEWKARMAARPKTPLEKMLIAQYAKQARWMFTDYTGVLEGSPLSKPKPRTTE